MSAEQTPDIEAAMRDVRAAVWNMCDQIIADHPMWIGDDGRPLNYLPEREARIADFVRELADTSAQALTPVLAAAVREALREAADEAEALKTFAHGNNPVSQAHVIGFGTARRLIVRQLRDRADRVAEPQHEAATSGKESEASDE